MIFKKTLALILIAGVLNPICCCFGAMGVEDASASGMHGCCEKPADDKGESSHNTDECPHKALAKLQESVDFSSNHIVKALSLFPMAYSHLWIDENFQEARLLHTGDVYAVAIPVVKLQQVNCTYLL